MTNLVTRNEVKVLSSPACSPQYTMTVPAGTRCKIVQGKPVVDDVSKVIGSNDHDLAHYYVWLEDSDVTTERIGVKEIKITRVEGQIKECDEPKIVDSWLAADSLLRRWSETAPEHGGYDKCDFGITFDDGYVYADGRYDLVHWRKERPDLQKHVRLFVRYLAGETPSWLLRDDKKRYLEHYLKDIAAHPERTEAAKRFLDTYDV